MKEKDNSLKFNLINPLKRAHHFFKSSVGSVTIKLPFISFSITPNDIERKTAKEIIIRLADRRVLNAFECCDDCIDRAIISLQKIRSFLIDTQVKLSEHPDSPLFLLIELQTEAIRQFITFEEKLQIASKENSTPSSSYDDQLPLHFREIYFKALEILRAHIHRCLLQISKIANIEIPTIPNNMRYNDEWQLDSYEQIEI